MHWFFLPLALACHSLILNSVASTTPTLRVDRNNSNASLVDWDNFSLKINGERVMIYSGEVHGFRYPGYSSWIDVFQKLKAAGFNTVSTYFFWGMIEAKQGSFNWDHFRSPQLFFDAASEVGLYVIARPGPYINAEVSSGGFPGWMQRVVGPARNSAANYTEAYMPYIRKVFAIIARNQLDRGGPVIALQLENEYDKAVGGQDFDYEKALAKAAKDAGITVPTTHNGALSSAFGNYFVENVDIWGYDEYPATKTVCPGPDTWAADAIQQFQWDMHSQAMYNPHQPMAIYEFEGGFKQPWGGKGYCSELASVEFMKMFNKNKYSMATTIFNIYMTWGGTNWGYLASPDVYTSYDFGSMIAEDRTLRTKYYEAKVQAHFLISSPAYLTATPVNIGNESNTFVDSSDRDLTITHTKDSSGGQTGFFFLRHSDASYIQETSFNLTLPTSKGLIKIPNCRGSLTLQGRDTKILVVDYAVGDYNLLYSSAEIMTSLVIDGITTVILYGDHGQTHESAITINGTEKIAVFGNDKQSTIVHQDEDKITLNYVTADKQVVHIGDKLHIYLLDRETAYSTWPIRDRGLIVIGGYLIRSAYNTGNVLHISGDLNRDSNIEIIGPRFKRLFFNDREVKFSDTDYGTRQFAVSTLLPDVTVPELTSLTWRYMDSFPEAYPSYNDSHWLDANLKQSFNPNNPSTPVSLLAGDYGFHTGIIIWRGHLKAAGGEAAINLDVYGGSGFAFSIYDDGKFVGSWAGNGGAENHAGQYVLPRVWRKGEEHVIAVIQDHHGYDMSWTANAELFKAPRGIFVCDFTRADNSSLYPTEYYWKVQGNLGGEDYVDGIRGPFNEGGLFGERKGWHLPNYPDDSWSTSSPVDGITQDGVRFYRTTFALKIPADVDYPVSIELPSISSNNPSRALIYVNGYQFGRYASNLGPQTIFPIPPSLLNLNGINTLVIALWALTEEGGALNDLKLNVNKLVEYGGPRFKQVPTPGFDSSEREHVL